MKKEVPTSRDVEIHRRRRRRRIHSANVSSFSSVFVQLTYNKRRCTANTNGLTFGEDNNTEEFSQQQGDQISEFISTLSLEVPKCFKTTSERHTGHNVCVKQTNTFSISCCDHVAKHKNV